MRASHRHRTHGVRGSAEQEPGAELAARAEHALAEIELLREDLGRSRSQLVATLAQIRAAAANMFVYVRTSRSIRSEAESLRQHRVLTGATRSVDVAPDLSFESSRRLEATQGAREPEGPSPAFARRARDRRQVGRLVPQPCPKCGHESALPATRTEYVVYFSCIHCSHMWSVQKPAGFPAPVPQRPPL